MVTGTTRLAAGTKWRTMARCAKAQGSTSPVLETPPHALAVRKCVGAGVLRREREGLRAGRALRFALATAISLRGCLVRAVSVLDTLRRPALFGCRERTIRVRGGLPNKNVGYPATVMTRDGALLTVYYGEDSDEVTCIMTTRWQIPEAAAR